MTIRQVVSSCPTCQLNNPWGAQKPSWPNQSSGEEHIQGKSGRQNFTQMPVSQGYKYLLVMIETFTGQIEGFPTWTERAEGVMKKVLYEIIPRFGLSKLLQSDNGTSFTSKVTQGISKALGITYSLHCAWRPKSSGKVERTKQFLKLTIKKIT